VSQFETPVHDKSGPWYTTSSDEVLHPHGLFSHPQFILMLFVQDIFIIFILN
jgi:hypothetical protein